MSMEFRVWITVESLPFPRADLWEPVITRLQRAHPRLGPVIGWDAGAARFIVSLEAADHARATRVAETAIVDALAAGPAGARILAIETEVTREHAMATV